MISFGRTKKEKGEIGFWIRGHANYKKDNDIVCAAVSAIGQTAAQGCQVYADTEIYHCEPGHIEFITRKNEKTDAIIKSSILGLQGIKESYPQCFE